MKKTLCLVIIILINFNFAIAQKFKKNETIVKSSNPLEINPNLDFEINTDIDSTLVSKETYIIVKKIEPLIKKEENKEALNLVNTIDKKDLEKNEILILKSILELKLNDLSNAYNSFTKYISVTKNDTINSTIYYCLGVIDSQRNFKISAFDNFKKSYELDNKNNSSIIILGVMSENKKDFDNAIFYYKIALKNNPNLNNIWNNLAFLYQKNENHKEAIKILSKIIRDEPDSPLPYSNRSYSNLMLGNTKKALEDVNKSINLFPENSYAFRNRAMIFIKLQNIKKACEDIETAIKLGYIKKYGTDLELLKTENCLK